MRVERIQQRVARPRKPEICAHLVGDLRRAKQRRGARSRCLLAARVAQDVESVERRIGDGHGRDEQLRSGAIPLRSGQAVAESCGSARRDQCDDEEPGADEAELRVMNDAHRHHYRLDGSDCSTSASLRGRLRPVDADRFLTSDRYDRPHHEHRQSQPHRTHHRRRRLHRLASLRVAAHARLGGLRPRRPVDRRGEERRCTCASTRHSTSSSTPS